VTVRLNGKTWRDFPPGTPVRWTSSSAGTVTTKSGMVVWHGDPRQLATLKQLHAALEALRAQGAPAPSAPGEPRRARKGRTQGLSFQFSALTQGVVVLVHGELGAKGVPMSDRLYQPRIGVLEVIGELGREGEGEGEERATRSRRTAT